MRTTSPCESCQCGAAAVAARDTAASPGRLPSRVALLGNPNVGKSVIFGLLSGRYVTVSNFPGTTVEVTRGTMQLGGAKVPVIDTPGTNGLVPQSEDERVARDLLLEEPATVIQVADAKNLPRALTLTLQVAEAGLPCVLALNMSDEAESVGLRLDAARLSEALGIPVIPTVATRREGLSRLRESLPHARVPRLAADYGEAIESAVTRVAAHLPAAPISGRALALAALSRDATLETWLRARLTVDEMHRLEQGLAAGAGPAGGGAAAIAIQETRVRAAAALARDVTGNGSRRRALGGAIADRLTLHPLWGYVTVLAVLYALYLFVGVFGAQTAVEWIERGLFGEIINPRLTAFVKAWSPWGFLADLIVGPYGLFTMGLTYAIAIVLPIVVTFFFAFALLEDSGYLPRLAVMLNRLFRLMGLNGRAVLPMVLGLGCDTMATLTTRILGTRKERLIVVLLLALGVPCSAQLGVVLGMLSALSFGATLIWGGVVSGVVLLVGWLASLVIPGERADFILEIPPLRRPTPGNLARKTLARVEWYLKEAVPLFLLGTLFLFLADRVRLLGVMERAVEPVVTTLLGLPAEASEAFIIGFLRRDFGAAGLYRLADRGMLDGVQVVVSLVVMTLFIPCIANFFMIVKEQGTRVAVKVALFIFPFAVLVGAALNVALRWMQVTL
jgi:ferrous iron transport protein B